MNKNYRMAKLININGKYVSYTNDTDLIKLQSLEIDRLNNKVSELENINEKIGLALDSAENKVNSLNNIISELEKWLIEQSEKVWDDNNYLDNVLDKLKELKKLPTK